MPEIEEIWEKVLSRDPELIRKGFFDLKNTDRCHVKTHLLKMATEIGWQPEQKISAQIALDAIKE